MQEAFAADEIVALGHDDWDVTMPAPSGLGPVDLVLHAAAWTDVDGAESDPQGAAAVNVGGTAHVAELGAPLVYVSTDYVFDGRKRAPAASSAKRCRRRSRARWRSRTPTGTSPATRLRAK